MISKYRPASRRCLHADLVSAACLQANFKPAQILVLREDLIFQSCQLSIGVLFIAGFTFCLIRQLPHVIGPGSGDGIDFAFNHRPVNLFDRSMLELTGDVTRSLRIATENPGAADRPIQAVRDTTVDFFSFRVLLAKPLLQSIFHAVDVRGTLGE